MKIIVINRLGKLRTLRLSSYLGIATATIIFAIPLVSGYFIGFKKAESWPEYFTKISRGVENSLIKQYEDVEQLKKTVGNKLLALNISIGEMQSEIVRLNAIAEKVSEHANIDSSEFDFSNKPPIGGPEEEAIPLTAEDVNLQLLNNIYQTQKQIANQVVQIDILNELLVNKTDNKQRTVQGFPTKVGWVSSPFGYRQDPFTGKHTFHKGIDIAGREGDPVISIAKGIVVKVSKKRGYGYVIDIKHGNDYMTRYAHNKTVLVHQGDLVSKGQSIAKIGSTGRSTGPHIHLEVFKNLKRVNPAEYIRKNL